MKTLNLIHGSSDAPCPRHRVAHAHHVFICVCELFKIQQQRERERGRGRGVVGNGGMRAKVQMTMWYLRWFHAYMFVTVYVYFDDIKRHPPRWQFVCSGEETSSPCASFTSSPVTTFSSKLKLRGWAIALSRVSHPNHDAGFPSTHTRLSNAAQTTHLRTPSPTTLSPLPAQFPPRRSAQIPSQTKS